MSGLARESLTLAVAFSTGSVRSHIGSLIEDISLRPIPSIVASASSDDEYGRVSVPGEILISSYLDWRGHLLSPDPHTDRYPALLPGYSLRFSLTFPPPGTVLFPDGTTVSVSPPFPLVIVQPCFFDSDPGIGNLIEHLTANGLAVLQMEGPPFSSPDNPFSDSLFPGLDIEAQRFDPVQFRDVFLQAAVSLSLLIQAIPRISDLDVYPAGVTGTGDGAADLDLTRIGFLGRASGALEGVLALSPQTEIITAVFQRIGGELGNLLNHYPPLGQGFRILLEEHGFSRKDTYLLTHLVDTLLDPVDPVNFLDFHEDPGGKPGLKNVLIQITVPDYLIPNSSSLALIRAADLPLISPAPASEPGIETLSGTVSGNLPGSYTGALSEFSLADLGSPGMNADQVSLQAARFFSTSLYTGSARIYPPE